MDSPEGSANDAMTAEIDCRDQMTQLLTALNGLMSTDRATPTPLTSSVPTPSTADTTIQATSDGITMAAEGRRKDYAAWSQQMRDKIELDARYIGSNADIWYFINSCLDSGPQQVVATFYAAGAEAGGADWADKAKIAFLEGALSTRLKRGLIYVELPKDDYHGWLLKAQDFAIKLESLPQQAYKGTPSYLKALQAGQRDAEGDMMMSGINCAKGKEKARA
ncbi:pol-like protein [Colletotrichum kahawae]|uniref:Pol-like protein n=1 Tax=Colletotrichum kahawae TaxID=34407 RepID=A0AAD9Y091_COLKA|nr:pol-like protein [Colletotrichum kahawae]